MERVITARTISATISAALFVITKIWAVQAAIIWCLVGEFNFSTKWAVVVLVVTCIPSLWASYKVSIMAYDAETDPENQPSRVERV